MEAIEMEDGLTIPATGDFCSSLLSRFSFSDHQHICTVAGAMAQGFKDQNLPPSAVAFFGAASSSLDRLTSSNPDPPPHVIDSLLTILSLALPAISPAMLRKKREVFSEIVVRVLRLNSLTVGAVVSGLKCIGHMLVAKDAVNWSDVSQLYCVLLGYVTDPRPKVRRHATISTRDVLQSFQGTSALAPASEKITDSFERFLLLAGGSNTEKPGGAQEVLYILDALKECLPLMSIKCKTNILKYYKTLIELRQPVVTRRVTDSLNVVCLQPAPDISADALLDLLCSLALSVSSNGTSVDIMTFNARLLDVGMRKVHSLNRQICVVKLPLVFSTLKDILSSGHEEAIFAATEALKSLINYCIDQSLIKQGVEQKMITTEYRMPGQTVIEKLCATTETLLDYHYNAVWDMVFQVVSTMFDKLGEYSSYFMKGTLKNLADMQGFSDEDFPHRKQLNECLGSALGAMGPEQFLGVLPLNLEAEDLSEVNVWLFPILKQYTVGAHLSFFTETVMGMISLMRQKSRKLELEGRTVSARSADALVYSLWSLLPSFCNYPLDTAESFKDLHKYLTSALHKESDIRGMICNAIQILIQQNKGVTEKNNDFGVSEVTARQRAMSHYNPVVAEANLKVLRSSDLEFLTVLSEILFKSSKDDGGCLQSTIREIASIANKEVVSERFRHYMGKIVKINKNCIQVDGSSNQSQPSLERARIFDLAVSLLPGLDDKDIDDLFSALKPALQDSEGLIQKKAYKVLSIVIQKCDGFLTSRLDELLQLMVEVLTVCHFSARRRRLDCLYFLILHIIKVDSKQRRHEILVAFLTEIILALKEANKKTRNRCYDMLVQIGHACGDEENGGNKENLFQFFNMMAGGMAGETPRVVSAAVKGLARLVYEFSDLVSTAYKLLPSTFLLFQRNNREIIKANLGLLKVLVAKSQSDRLEMHLGSLVQGLLLNWQGNTKNHFKAKVKHLLQMLVRKCGLDAVMAVMPEGHMRLLTNIRKIKERKEKKLLANYGTEVRSHLSRATTSRLSKWNHSRIFSDFGVGDSEYSDAEFTDAKTVSGQQSKKASVMTKSRAGKAVSLRSKKMRRSDKSLLVDLFDQLVDEPLDLLDRHKTRSAPFRTSDGLKRKKQESDDEMEMDSEGRLVILEEGVKLKEKPSNRDSDAARSEMGSQVSSSSSSRKRQKTSSESSGWAYTGNEYSSKKAGGDLKKKDDKLEPYAYWPLDRKMMSRRPEQRADARKGMASVVRRSTKKLQGKSLSNALSMKLAEFKKGSK